MNELIDTVARQAGISRDQAEQAVDVMLHYAKTRLSPQMIIQLQGALSGQDASGISPRAHERIDEYRDAFDGQK